MLLLLFYTPDWAFPSADDETWTRQLSTTHGTSLLLLLGSNPIWVNTTATVATTETWTERTAQAEVWTERTKQAETWAEV